jgi:hypothetical protein
LDFIFFVARSKRLPPLKTKGETHLGVSISEEMETDIWKNLGIRRAVSGLAGILVSVGLSLFPMLEMLKARPLSPSSVVRGRPGG